MKKTIIILCLLLIPFSGMAADSQCSSLFQGTFFSRNKTKILKLSYQIPLAATLSFLVWKEIDTRLFWPAAEANVATNIVDVVQPNKNVYDKLIEKDFRYRHIKRIEFDRDAQQLDPRLKELTVQKRVLAHNTSQHYKQYYDSIAHRNPLELSVSENSAQYLSTPLFKHLVLFFENGVIPIEGTVVEKHHQRPLSNEQAKYLFDRTHILYFDYFAIDAFKVSGKTDNAIFTTNFAKELFALHEQKRITRDEVIYYLQEDAYHAYYMDIFQKLNIKNLKYEDGAYSNQILTLDDLRSERLRELRSK